MNIFKLASHTSLNMTAHRFPTVLSQHHANLELVSNQRGHCVGKHRLQATTPRAVQAFLHGAGLDFYIFISKNMCTTKRQILEKKDANSQDKSLLFKK